jgi:hypothetical protein
MLTQHFVEEHRRSFLYVVAASMQQRIEGEVRSGREVVAVRTPRNSLLGRLGLFGGIGEHYILPQSWEDGGDFLWVHPDAYGRFLIESFDEVFETFLTKDRTDKLYEIVR